MYSISRMSASLQLDRHLKVGEFPKVHRIWFFAVCQGVTAPLKDGLLAQA